MKAPGATLPRLTSKEKLLKSKVEEHSHPLYILNDHRKDSLHSTTSSERTSLTLGSAQRWGFLSAPIWSLYQHLFVL
jgi:hypothetical protein